MRDLVVRALGAVTLCALVSLWVQVDGLIGTHGILPFPAYLAERASEPWWRTPTLFWWWQTDAALHTALATGCLLAGALVLGVRVQGPLLLGLWAIYLSLSQVGQAFLSFQWDTLLVETLFASLFIARWQTREDRAPSRVGVWILRWTLFKLMLASGLVKLTSGDPTWWDGSAMAFHYWTQPIPNPVSWYAHHLPAWFHRLETWATLFIEIVLPFAIFAGRPGRRVALVGFTLVLALLFGTGNYGFFQWLSLVLVLSLLEPRDDRRQRPARWAATVVCSIWLGATVLIGTVHSYGRVFDYRQLPEPALDLVRAAYPWRTVNAYGLFARMTTDRDEVWIEGSDGGPWLRYTLPYQPGPLDRRPPVLGLHMPRLDWQLWFAALRPCRGSPWLDALLGKLKEGEPVVLGLFDEVPFPAGAERVRTRVARTTFSDGGDAWWASGPPRPHCPAR